LTGTAGLTAAALPAVVTVSEAGSTVGELLLTAPPGSPDAVDPAVLGTGTEPRLLGLFLAEHALIPRATMAAARHAPVRVRAVMRGKVNPPCTRRGSNAALL
jgi:hypothetical protein